MEIGDIIFINGKSPISKIIRFFDGGKFSHVAIAVSSTHIVESQYFTRVRITPMNYQNYEIVRIDLNDIQKEQLIKDSIQLTGRWYDYIQIVWYLFKKLFHLNPKSIWNSPNNLICSELVALLLINVGFLKITDYPNLLDKTPFELYEFLTNKTLSQR